jgi:hypothetical protein
MFWFWSLIFVIKYLFLFFKKKKTTVEAVHDTMIFFSFFQS